MIFEALDAGHGDMLLLTYGPEPRRLLIDGGPSKVGRGAAAPYSPVDDRLMPLLRALAPPPMLPGMPAPPVHLDLVVCTHIDLDHIDGIERLYRILAGDAQRPAAMPEIDARRLWFNSFSALLGATLTEAEQQVGVAPGAVAAAVSDGENLTRDALKYGAEINQGAPGKIVECGHVPQGLGPAKITVLAPHRPALEKLRREWLKKVPPAGASPAALAATVSRPDQSIANLSSIAMLVELDGKRILLTGDARSDHVVEGLETCGFLQAGPFHVDIMKVPHHGSEANVLPGFEQRITADHYVFSANGKDQNPDPPVVARIAREARSGRRFTMHFTHGDMAYEPRRDGTLPTLDDKPCATLKAVIAQLKKDPKVKANVRFKFRASTKPSLAITL